MLRASLWDVRDQHGGWAVHVRSVPTDELDQHATSALRSAVGDAHLGRREIIVHDACVLLSARGDGASAKAVAHVDPRLNFVPRWLVEFVLMAMMPMVYSRLCHELQCAFAEEGSKHNKRNIMRGMYEQVLGAARQHQTLT